jgi:hypothetical protein
MTARADGSHLILLLDLATQHPIDLDLVVRMLQRPQSRNMNVRS